MKLKNRSLLVGSLAASLLASACCIGPLVLGLLGLGSLGIAGSLAPLRPWFLALTALFLAAGFYLAYRPEPASTCSAEACAKPAGRRAQRAALWIVVLGAVALATYPAWGIRPPGARGSAPALAPASTVVVLDVQGMTCAGCAAAIQEEFQHVPNVVDAEVRFEEGTARVVLSTPRADVKPLVAAVEKAGYRATVRGR